MKLEIKCSRHLMIFCLALFYKIRIMSSHLVGKQSFPNNKKVRIYIYIYIFTQKIENIISEWLNVETNTS